MGLPHMGPLDMIASIVIVQRGFHAPAWCAPPDLPHRDLMGLGYPGERLPPIKELA
jgi:hypothetical protein